MLLSSVVTTRKQHKAKIEELSLEIFSKFSRVVFFLERVELVLSLMSSGSCLRRSQ